MRFRRGGLKRAIMLTAAKRVLRKQGSVTAALNAETGEVIFTTVDAPTSLTTAEAGCKLTLLKVRMFQVSTGTAGDKYEFLLYVNRSGLGITSSTPIADFWATTEPVTAVSMRIRKAALKYGQYIVPSSATSAGAFFATIKFRQGMTLYDGDELKLVIKNPNASNARDFKYDAIAITRK